MTRHPRPDAQNHLNTTEYAAEGVRIGLRNGQEMLSKVVNSAWSTLEYIWSPLLLFVATPWFLRQLGTEQYGHWMLLTATVGFGGALNTGTGAAIIRAVSASIGRGSDAGTQQAIATGLAVGIIGGCGLALLVFLVFWFGAEAILTRMGDPQLVRLTAVAAACLILVEQIDNVFSSAIKGAEQFGHSAAIEIASKTIQILVASLTILYWPELSSLYVALVAVALLRLFVKITIATRLLSLSQLLPELSCGVEFLRFAKWGWLQGVGGVLFGVADRLLVGSLLGATSLTYYSIASQLTIQIHAACAAGVSVIFPMISRKLEANDRASVLRGVRLALRANVLLSSMLSVALLLFGSQLLRIWLGDKTSAPIAEVLPYLVLSYWLLALNATPHYVLLSLGRIRFLAVCNLVAGCLLMLGIWIAADHGLVGVATARALYGLVTLVTYIPLVRWLRRNQWEPPRAHSAS